MPKPRPTAPASPPRSRTRLGVDERRAQLIERGLATFSARPYDDISMDELAEAAGISKGLLYHYFAGKRDYYVAVLDHAAQRLVRETTPPARDVPTPERLRRGLDTYLDFVERHGAAFVALLRGGIGSDAEVARILERTRDAYVARIVEDLPPALDAPVLRTALRGWVGFVEAVALDWVDKRTVTREQVAALATGAMLAVVQVASGHSLAWPA